MRDTFDTAYVCEDCGRRWNSYAAMMQCPCQNYTSYGYPKA